MPRRRYLLGALADKSLLRDDARLAPSAGPAAAALRLPDGDERASTARAHALYFHRLLAQLRRPAENGDAGALAQTTPSSRTAGSPGTGPSCTGG
jgi:hypothetical protein